MLTEPWTFEDRLVKRIIDGHEFMIVEHVTIEGERPDNVKRFAVVPQCSLLVERNGQPFNAAKQDAPFHFDADTLDEAFEIAMERVKKRVPQLELEIKQELGLVPKLEIAHAFNGHSRMS